MCHGDVHASDEGFRSLYEYKGNKTFEFYANSVKSVNYVVYCI